jgi:hypothetical protein
MSRGILYSLFNLGSIWRWVVNTTPRPLYARELPGTNCIGGCVGPRAGLDGCGKSRPNWIQSANCPFRSQSLSRPTQDTLQMYKNTFFFFSKTLQQRLSYLAEKLQTCVKNHSVYLIPCFRLILHEILALRGCYAALIGS